MFSYLFETVRKHLLPKYCLGLFLAFAMIVGADFTYRSGFLAFEKGAADNERARRISRDLGAIVAKPLFEGNRTAVDSALRVLGIDERLAAARVVDASGHDVAVTGAADRVSTDMAVATHGVDYEDGQGNKTPVGVVVVALRPQEGAFHGLGKGPSALVVPAALMLICVAGLGFAARLASALKDIEEGLKKLATGQTDIDLGGTGRPDEIGRISSAVHAVRDILRQHEQIAGELQALLAQRNTMLDFAPIAILVERDAAIVACNASGDRLFGYSPGELIGRPCKTLYASVTAFTRVYEEAERARQHGVAYCGESELQRKDGTIFWGALHAAVAPAADAGDCTLWVCRDISGAKRAEADAFHRRLRLEQLVAERTRQLEEARRAALTGVATEGAPPQSRCETEPSTIGGRIERLCFNPASVLEGVAALLAPQAEEKGLELLLDVDSRLPPLLMGDPLRLAEVLACLLSNALRYSKHGDVVAVAREAGRGPGRVRVQFSVRDRGIGLTSAQRVQLLAGGDQASASSTGRGGLGLAISKRLVERMGGTLEIESRYGQGSTFHFTLEFEFADQDGGSGRYAEQLQARAGRRVMVIDDNRAARLATAGLLTRLGFAPSLFESGWGALASLARPDTPDYLFICIDRRMPELDGLEVARRLHARYGSACPPLLLLTVFSHAAELQGAAHGFAAVVSKPLTIDRLFKPVAEVLGVSPAPSEGIPMSGLKSKRVLFVCDGGMYRELMVDFLHAAGLEVRAAANLLEALQAARETAPDCVLLDCRISTRDVSEAVGSLRALGYPNLPIIALTLGITLMDRAALLTVGVSDVVAEPADLPALLGLLAKWTAQATASAPVADRDALPPLPPELDVECGLRRLSGKTGLFLKALRMFRDSCGEQFQLEFRSAVRAGDWQTSARLAHSLKDTAAAIGARQVSAAAARLEAAIRSSNYAVAQSLLADVAEKLRILVDGLAHIR